MIEVLYIGNHSVHLPVDLTQLNGIPRQYLSTLATRDPNQTYLTASIPNPFAGLSTGTTSTFSSTTSPVQLLAHYPEFTVGDSSTGWNSSGVLEENNNVGSSYFDSLNIGFTKRISKGLQLHVNYIKSRLIEFDSWLNDSDARPEKRDSPSDHPNRLVIFGVYQLPFGKGQHFNIGSHLGNAVFGGWNLTTVYTAQTGAPITWVNGSSSVPGDYVYLGGPLDVNDRQPNGTAFNTAVFDTKSADAFNYHLRTFPTTFMNARTDGINQLDTSVLKRFAIGERRSFELRGEFYNTMNHAIFGPPSTTASSSGFGTITTQANTPRSVQLVARLYW
jgi:hypothetical protein